MAKSDQMKAQALSALLDSSTLTEAAEKAQISRKTLYTYLRTDQEFAWEYQSMQEQLALEHMETLASDRQRARAVIIRVMDDEEQPVAIRLKAALSLYGIAQAQQSRVDAISNTNATRSPFADMF
jgi:hypothetical protein